MKLLITPKTILMKAPVKQNEHEVCVRCGVQFKPHLMKPLTICDKCADAIAYILKVGGL